MTTNSDGGIESYDVYYPVFEAMQEHGLVLNLHGEVPASATISVLNAEEAFLPHLEKLHKQFPRLRIVLEHATSAAAVAMVKSLGDNVACSITVHVNMFLIFILFSFYSVQPTQHLDLIVDDWAGKSVNFCKPVAKTPADREALRSVIKEGNTKFFLGSDSAPHPRKNKQSEAGAPAGVYTTPFVLPYLAQIFEDLGCLDKLEGTRFFLLRNCNVFDCSCDRIRRTQRRQILRPPTADAKGPPGQEGASGPERIPLWGR